MSSGGGWRYKSKNYLRKCSGNAYLLNIIRIFGVEAVWKQPNLPPHRSTIYLSEEYNPVFTLSGGWRQNKKNIFKRKKHRVSELYEGYIGVLMYKLPEYNVFLLFRFKKHDVIDGHIGNAFLGEHLWLITQHVRKTNAIIRGFDEMAE